MLQNHNFANTCNKQKRQTLFEFYYHKYMLPPVSGFIKSNAKFWRSLQINNIAGALIILEQFAD